MTTYTTKTDLYTDLANILSGYAPGEGPALVAAMTDRLWADGVRESDDLPGDDEWAALVEEYGS